MGKCQYRQPVSLEAGTGMVDLGSLQGRSARATVVSADGSVIAWRGTISWQRLARLMHPNGWMGEVLDWNDTGSILVGIGRSMNIRHAYRFTAWYGRVEDLGALERAITEAQKSRRPIQRPLRER